MDSDSKSPWEENPDRDTDHLQKAEWNKFTSDLTNSGHRRGITAGKEAFLQPAFDAGFANVGVPLGRELGNLRGAAAAIQSLLNSQSPESLELEEIRNISSILSAIRFSDIAPRDFEAEQHAKDHLGFGDTDSGVEAVPQEKETIKNVARLKERLALLNANLGLPALP